MLGYFIDIERAKQTKKNLKKGHDSNNVDNKGKEIIHQDYFEYMTDYYNS
jgi:hypothetical protein